MTTVYRALQRARTEARIKFIGDVSICREILVQELHNRNAHVAETAGTETLMRVAQAVARSDASLDAVLHRFVEAVRPSLYTYVTIAARHSGKPVVTPAAYSVLEHINTYTDAPIDPNWLTRMILCAQYTYRAWRRMRREHRDSGAQDGVSR